MKSIFNYDCPQQFLQDTFQDLQTKQKGLTLTRWAKFLDISSNFLIEVFKGRKTLKLRHADLFVHGLELTQEEAKYFKAIIKYNASMNQDEQKLLEELIFNLRSKHLGTVKQNVLDERSAAHNWLFYALSNLPFLEKKFSTESIHHVMLSDVSSEEIEQTLADLLDSGLLTTNAKGELERKQTAITTKNDISIPEVHEYYRKVSSLAVDSIPLDLNEREFQCFSLPIKKDKLPYFKELIREFRNTLAKECEFRGDDIYQVNLQLFPLTRTDNHVTPEYLSSTHR